jgi:hypothetical protein
MREPHVLPWTSAIVSFMLVTTVNAVPKFVRTCTNTDSSSIFRGRLCLINGFDRQKSQTSNMEKNFQIITTAVRKTALLKKIVHRPYAQNCLAAVSQTLLLSFVHFPQG